MRVKLISSRTESAANRNTRDKSSSFVCDASKRYRLSCRSFSAGNAPAVIFKCENPHSLPGSIHAALLAAKRTPLAGAALSVCRTACRTWMISALQGSNSMPTASKPISAATNNEVPLPANGSSTGPVIPVSSMMYRINAAENPSRYLHQRCPTSALFA